LLLLMVVAMNKPLPDLRILFGLFIAGTLMLQLTQVDKHFIRAVLTRPSVALTTFLCICGYWLWILIRWEHALIPGIEHESFLIYRVEMAVLGLPSSIVSLVIVGILNSTYANHWIRDVFAWNGRIIVDWLCFFLPFIMQILIIWKRRAHILALIPK
jgi:hypothetical protein